MVAILTVSHCLSILADTMASPVTTQSATQSTRAATQAAGNVVTVSPVPGAGEFIATAALLGGLCAVSACVFVWMRRMTVRVDDATSALVKAEPSGVLEYARSDASMSIVEAYRLAMILFGALLLMTLLPSVLVGVFGAGDARFLQLVGATTRAVTLVAALGAVAGFVPGGLRKIGLQVGKLPQAWVGVGALLLAAPWIYMALFVSQIVFRATGLMPQQQTHETLTLIRTNADPIAVAVATFGAVVLAPAMEEVLFRGLMQTSMQRLTNKPWIAIGATSLFFALIHPPFSIPAIFVLSLTLGYLYHRTRNLWAAIAFHVAFNAANTGLTLLMR